MGLIDSILGIFNPGVTSKYKNLVNNHPEAFRRWRGKQIVGTLSQYFDFDPTYSDKSYIASHEKEILAFEAIIAEEKAFEKRRQKVIKAASDYPHAFVALLKKLSVPSIPGITATLPGQRKSKRSQRIEREHSNNKFSLSSIISISETLSSIGEIYSNVNRVSRSINTLTKEEYEKLHDKLYTLASEETRIKKELQKEDSLMRFEDEVLDNEIRIRYYQDFCKLKSVTGTEEEKMLYCVGHLIELDAYALNKIDKAYRLLRSNYPLGLNAFENTHKNMVRSQIIDHENEIKIYETNHKQVSIQNEWENAQKIFTKESRHLNNSLLTNYGCYVYDIPFRKLAYDGKMVSATYRVWQHFLQSYCNVEGLDYSYYPSVRENYNELADFKAISRYFYDRVYDKIIEFAEALRQKYNNLVIVLGDSALGDDSVDFNNYHFSHLKQSLAERNIKFFSVDEIVHQSEIYSYIVVVELISTNEGLITTCKKLIESYKKACPKITYVSLCKELSKSEMTDLINRKKQEKEREERAKREEERAKESRRKEILAFEKAVSTWPFPTYARVRCFSLYNYYPTTCNWEASSDEWDIRKLIWNFKANPNRPTPMSEIIMLHEESMQRVLPDLIKCLTQYFGSNLKKLTLVCIPSSKKEVTERRYKQFSEILTSNTGMANGYDYIQVVKDGGAKHLGETTSATYQINSTFFNGRYVLLFDDVITSGKSMAAFANTLQKVGAYVVGGISLGRTKHQRELHNPIDLI